MWLARLRDQFVDSLMKGLDVERLLDHGAIVQTEKLLNSVIEDASGEEDKPSRQLRATLDRTLEDIHTAQPRHRKITDNQIEIAVGLDCGQGLRTAVRELHVVRRQQFRDRGADDRLVIYDQYSIWHAAHFQFTELP